MKNEINFVWSRINFETGLLDVNDLKWDKSSLKDIMKAINESKKGKTSLCALVHPKDIEGGNPIDKEVTFNMFVADPCKYGVSIYKTWNNNVVIE